jgi:acyl carrier protein
MDELVNALKQGIIKHLSLDDIGPDDIDANAPLFEEGLGLDSIDALELVVLLEHDYKIKLDNLEEARKVFASINAMARYITEQRRT